ncbi:MAG: hypothetical protein MZV63_44050 [Marinilabiliales bacterium]|nr:hypothetical protein [Marinilabiliales bacterium]
MAYVASKSGNETLRLLRTINTASAQKTADPYSQITGQILLNSKIDKDNVVQGLVLKFDDSYQNLHPYSRPPSASNGIMVPGGT